MNTRINTLKHEVGSGSGGPNQTKDKSNSTPDNRHEVPCKCWETRRPAPLNKKTVWMQVDSTLQWHLHIFTFPFIFWPKNWIFFQVNFCPKDCILFFYFYFYLHIKKEIKIMPFVLSHKYPSKRFFSSSKSCDISVSRGDLTFIFHQAIHIPIETQVYLTLAELPIPNSLYSYWMNGTVYNYTI